MPAAAESRRSSSLKRATIALNSFIGAATLTTSRERRAFTTQSYFLSNPLNSGSLKRNISRKRRFARFLMTALFDILRDTVTPNRWPSDPFSSTNTDINAPSKRLPRS